MNRVLSLLLLVPFLITQVLPVTPIWARGGPYDDMMSRTQSALAGTYGVALTGSAGTYSWQDAKTQTPDDTNSSVTGVMALSLPAVGMATGRVLLFKEGLMYMGTAQGMADNRNGTMKLLSQLSHYFVRIGTDGSTQTSSAVIDSIYSGQINLTLAVDYPTGLIEASGDARFSEYNPLVQSVSTSTSTKTTNSDGTGPGNTTTTTSGNSTTSSNTAVITEADGSTTTTTTSKTTAVSSVDTSADTVTVSTKNYDTSTQSGTDTKRKLLDLQMSASGVRQSPTVTNIAAFAAPSLATSFQVDSAAGAAAGP
jgi:hypothetical protein